MKKIIYIFVAICISVIAISCGKSKSDNSSDSYTNIAIYGIDETENLDTTILAQIGQGSTELTFIPRDSFVTGFKNADKLSQVYKNRNDISDLNNVVSDLTNKQIKYYVVLNISDVKDILKELSPISFDVPDVYGNGTPLRYDDDSKNLHINIDPGEQLLNEENIADLMVWRKNNDEGIYDTEYNDFDRISTQQKLLVKIVESNKNISVGTMIKIFTDIKDGLDTNINDIGFICDVLPGEYSTDITKPTYYYVDKNSMD